MARIVVAPTAYKGTLGPVAAAEVIAAAIAEARPDAEVAICPVADGGDGTIDVLHHALGGELHEVSVAGPYGSSIPAPLLMLPTEVAVVEMATASGLALTSKREVLKATTRGTGQLVSAALDHAPRRVIVAVGGSASVDCGIGSMEALGVTFLGAGRFLAGASDLEILEEIDLTFRDKRLDEVELIAACDVVNPLLGPQGAIAFASQKGAASAELEVIIRGFDRFAEIVMQKLGRWIGETPHGGAGGGMAGGMYGVLGAELASGFDLIATMTDLRSRLAGAKLVVVGEGSLDRQSLGGKAPIAAARMAAEVGAETWAIAGRVELTDDELEAAHIARALALPEGSDPASGLKEATLAMFA